MEWVDFCCIFSDHPPNSNKAACSIKALAPSLGAKDFTLGSGKGANHMLAPSATSTLCWGVGGNSPNKLRRRAPKSY